MSTPSHLTSVLDPLPCKQRTRIGILRGWTELSLCVCGCDAVLGGYLTEALASPPSKVPTWIVVVSTTVDAFLLSLWMQHRGVAWRGVAALPLHKPPTHPQESYILLRGLCSMPGQREPDVPVPQHKGGGGILTGSACGELAVPRRWICRYCKVPMGWCPALVMQRSRLKQRPLSRQSPPKGSGEDNNVCMAFSCRGGTPKA